MDTQRQAQFRQELDQISTRLAGDLSTISEQTQSPAGGQAAGELTNLPQHLGDQGTEEYLHGLNTTLLENEEYIAAEVTAARNRLDDGTFGICEACGEPIVEERLEAIPYARYCTTCAERLDPIFIANYNTGRPQQPQETLSYDRHAEQTADHDRLAAGTPGGGSALGGLAGTTEGHGDPDKEDLESAHGSSAFDALDARTQGKIDAVLS